MAEGEEQIRKMQEQIGRIDERTLYMGREISEFKVILERHRSESREGSTELKQLMTVHMAAQASREEGQDKRINDQVQDLIVVRTENKRDKAWMYGIFMVLWGGIVGWLKIKSNTGS